MTAPSLAFLGAAQTVTGSRFLVECADRRILVDCGIFQGVKELRLRNWEPFPVDPAGIDAVIVTHAHLDHVGYLPLLVRHGFRGAIHSSIPTRELAEIMLLDAAHIQEEEAAQANEEGYSKHRPARPLYTTEDAKRAMGRFAPVSTGDWHELFPRVRFRLSNSGHILGSTFVELDCQGTRVVFSGDLGRKEPLLLRPREAIERADFLVLESTYGDRVHPSEPVLASLARVVTETYARGGTLVIPSFAVGRTQDLLYLFRELRAQKKIPDVPLFLDSPMAIEATRLFDQFRDWHRLEERGVKSLVGIAALARTEAESRALLRTRKPRIVIAGAGMVTGGRVLRHLEKHLPDEASTVLLVGYQAPGTRGRQLKDGAEEVKMHGQYVPVHARIEELSTLSAHADQKEIVQWLKAFRTPPELTFLVHGEPQSADALRVKIKDVLGWNCRIPHTGERATLARTRRESQRAVRARA